MPFEGTVEQVLLETRTRTRPRRCCRDGNHGNERARRLLAWTKFVLVFLAAGARTVAAPAIAMMDVGIIGALYLLFARPQFEPIAPMFAYRFTRTLADLVVLATLRTIAVSSTIALCGTHEKMYERYVKVSWVCAMVTWPIVAAKSFLYHYTGDWLPPVLFVLSATFPLLHLLRAWEMLVVARRQRRLGLIDFRSNGQSPISTFAPHVNTRMHEEDYQGRSMNRSDSDEAGTSADDLADKHSCFVELNGLTIHYKILGREFAREKCIVLLHGFGGGAFSWRHVMEKLASKTRCRVLAIDRPGFGLSSKPDPHDLQEDRNPYLFSNQVQLCLDLCSLLGVQEMLLVGHEDGAMLATMVATRNLEDSKGFSPAESGAASWENRLALAEEGLPIQKPKAVGLVLLSSGLSEEVILSSFTDMLLRARLGRSALRSLLKTELSDVLNRRSWYDPNKITPELVEEYRRPFALQGWEAALTEISRLRTRQGQMDVCQSLAKQSSLPVMVIVGEEDRLLDVFQAAELASKIPRATVVTLGECGHLPHEEVPDQLLSHLCTFASTWLLSSNHVQ